MSLETKYHNWVVKFNNKFNDNSILMNEFIGNLHKLEYKLFNNELKSELLSCCDKLYRYFLNKNHYANNDLEKLISELKINIIYENWWSIFYNVQRILEISTDILIKNIINQNLIEDYYLEKLRCKLKLNQFNFCDRIEILKKVRPEIDKKDLNIYIDIMEVLNRLRNKYMFHHNNYDTLSYIFDSLIEKDKKLEQLVNTIIDDVDKLSLKLNLSQTTLLKIKDYFNNFYIALKINIENDNKEKYVHINDYFYQDLPKYICVIGFIFILFIGKKDLDLM